MPPTPEALGDEPSRQTMESVAQRVMAFLIGVAKYPAIAAALATRGYNAEAHDFAWDRLRKLGTLPGTKSTASISDKAVRAAILELDAWDEPNFAIAQAVLNNSYPRFTSILFDDLTAKQGFEAVYGVSLFLDRLDALEKSGDPEAPAVLKRLSDRGYTKAERQRLRELVDIATKYAPAPVISNAERDAVLAEIHGWHKEWAEIAKHTISRRQHLIALGLASPRKAKKAGEDPKPA